MQQSSTPASPVAHAQTWAAFLLSWVAGFSDAIGFLVLQQLGASFMTGNSMAAGAALGRMDWSSVLRYGLPIVTFVLGIVLGFITLTLISRLHLRSSFSIIFGLEMVAMFAFLLLGSYALQHGTLPLAPAGGIFYVCIALLPFALGLQTATIQRASGQGVHTTFVTGVLNDWAYALMHYLFWLHGQITERGFRYAVRVSAQQTAFRRLLLLGSIWGCYVVGAICGSALELRLALSALIFPLCALAVLILIDIIRPFER
jgi:uncharacterized membrane protein YoaK (UPF0700 family)